VLANRAANLGCGRFMTFLKASLQFLPSIGWTHYFQGSVFLKRNWQSDENAIKKKLEEIEINNFPRPFWIGIYPEGTRITSKKHEESVKFAQQRGLPQLNFVLLPRTKGFVTVVQSLPTAITALYDTTVAYQNAGFNLLDPLFHGQWKCKAVNVYFKRIPFHTLPRDEEGLNKWLYEDFRQKDLVLQHFEINQTFPGQIIRSNTDYLHHLVVWILWSTIFTGAVYLMSGNAPFATFSLTAQFITLLLSSLSSPSPSLTHKDNNHAKIS